jgi:hypothetical protein
MLDTLVSISEDEYAREKLDLAFSSKTIQQRKEWLLGK